MITVSDIGIQFGKRILFKEVNLYNKGRNILVNLKVPFGITNKIK